jgi:hypothetical protein
LNRARVEIPFTGGFIICAFVFPLILMIFLKGAAVYAYGIMNNQDDSAVSPRGITSRTYLTFLMDGHEVSGSFEHEPSRKQIDGSYFEFDVLVYSNTTLGYYGQHNLTIMNGGGNHPSMFLFDYVKYT